MRSLGVIVEGINDLLKILYSFQDEGLKRGVNTTYEKKLISDFLGRFRSISNELPPEYKGLRKFIEDSSNEEDYTWALDSSIVLTEWKPEAGGFYEKDTRETRTLFLTYGFQQMIWELIARSFEEKDIEKSLPHCKESLTQFYEDLLNGVGEYSDRDTLEILHEQNPEKFDELYPAFLEAKKQYKRVHDELSSMSVGVEGIKEEISKNLDFNFKLRRKIGNWCNTMFALSQFDPEVMKKVFEISHYLGKLQYSIKKKSELKRLKERARKRRAYLESQRLTSNIVRLDFSIEEFKKMIRSSIEELERRIREKLKDYPVPTEWWDDYKVVKESVEKKPTKRVYRSRVRVKEVTVAKLPLEQRIIELLSSEGKMVGARISKSLDEPGERVVETLKRMEKEGRVRMEGVFWVLSEKKEKS